MAQEFVSNALAQRHMSKEFTFENAQCKSVEYYLLDYAAEYKVIPVKLAVCYSCSLEEIKKKTISRRVMKESLLVTIFGITYQ